MSPGDLRIGFDYWPAATHAPGVGRYVRELVRALAFLEHGPQLRLLDIGPAGESLPQRSLDLSAARRAPLVRRWRARRGWIELLQRTHLVRAETWMGPLEVFQRARLLGGPRARAPEVAALAEFPRTDPAQEQALRTELHALAAVLVFSRAAQAEAMRRFQLEEARLKLVPVGCDHWLRDLPARAPVRERARLLVLGAVRMDSAHVEVLRAFERLRARGQDADLVFCGRRADGAPRLDEALRSSSRRSEVRWIEEPMESEMPALLSRASVLVLLAREAWTPVTVLEACAHGLAVVASRLPCFEEALGPHAEYVESGADTPLDQGLDAALENTFRSRLEEAAREARCALARRFTWEANARATLAVYAQIAQRGSSRS